MTSNERLERITTLRNVFILKAPKPPRQPETPHVDPEQQGGTLFNPALRDEFIARYSLGYAPYTWNVIVRSFFNENQAKHYVDGLNQKYGSLFFKETQSNTKESGSRDIWMVTLGAGVGARDANKLLDVANYVSRTYGDLNGSYKYCWSVGPKDPNGECKK
jgi:hypothetical protein